MDKQSQEQLEEELGFSPEVVIDSLIDAARRFLVDSVSSVENTMLETENLQEAKHKKVIKEGIKKVNSQLEEELKKNTAKLEVYCIRNLFSLPSSVLSQRREDQKKSNNQNKKRANQSFQSKRQGEERINKIDPDVAELKRKISSVSFDLSSLFSSLFVFVC
eukprot:TRINITY_DN4583_c0_g1_i1.p1 TRINITY_DN4583_c0_g1~~TRINITY_DN4583_c0_g1_i1.p1  ORF type:complete len:162 (-),score=58.74 TRINITY_DN4583_c0_g1_i1:238-723(-)